MLHIISTRAFSSKVKLGAYSVVRERNSVEVVQCDNGALSKWCWVEMVLMVLCDDGAVWEKGLYENGAGRRVAFSMTPMNRQHFPNVMQLPLCRRCVSHGLAFQICPSHSTSPLQ